MLNGSDPIIMLTLLVGLAALPFAAMMTTSFTKIIIVLSLLRNALGIQQVPPGIVLNGLAIVLSIYVMYPVGLAAYNAGAEQIATQPGPVTFKDLLQVSEAAKDPLKRFLTKHSEPAERAFFLKASHQLMGEATASSLFEDDMIILVPAFVTAEITAAFEIGFLVFLPFLVIDFIVASTLMALGMQMLSPTTIALPFKLLLIVMLNGWSRLLHALVLSYQ